MYVVENRHLTGITLVEVLSRIEKETNGELVAVVADAEDVPSSIAESVLDVGLVQWGCRGKLRISSINMAWNTNMRKQLRTDLRC